MVFLTLIGGIPHGYSSHRTVRSEATEGFVKAIVPGLLVALPSLAPAFTPHEVDNYFSDCTLLLGKGLFGSGEHDVSLCKGGYRYAQLCLCNPHSAEAK